MSKISKQRKPFLEVKDGSLYGNERFQGYIPDLIKLLSKELGFRYILRLVKDGIYGNKEPDGTWNGMIGEVMRQVYSIGIIGVFTNAQNLPK